VTLLYDELRDAVAGRTTQTRVDAQGRRFVALSVRFSRAIPQATLTTLTEESPHATTRIPGNLTPLTVEITPHQISMLFEPIDPAILRLDTLLSALAWSGSPLGSPLSAYVIVELCRAVQSLHTTADADGAARVHREIHAGTVLIDPGGKLRLFGCGVPATSAVMLARLTNRAARHRLLAPETARGEPLDPRADVYSLGVLYYELLSGHRYREHMNAAAIAKAAIEGYPPDLPASLPDPRPELVRVLSRALAPQADQRFFNARMLSDAILAEIASAKITLPQPTVLERMVDEFVPSGVERGKIALVHAEHDPAEFERLMSGGTETISNTPAKTTPAKPAAPDAWARVLGEQVTADERGTEPAPPAEPEPRRSIALPLPTDPSLGSALTLPAPAAETATTLPLSGDHLAGLVRPSPSRGPRRPVASDDDAPKHTSVRIAIGLAMVALGGAVVFGLMQRPASNDPIVQTAIDAGPTTTDAGPAAIAAQDAGEVAAKTVGLLTVLSKPSGAAVEIDGGYVGDTPLVRRHEFQHRGYQIRVLANGYHPWEQTAYPDDKLAINVIAELLKQE
jgi:hypothetical protein